MCSDATRVASGCRSAGLDLAGASLLRGHINWSTAHYTPFACIVPANAEKALKPIFGLITYAHAQERLQGCPILDPLMFVADCFLRGTGQGFKLDVANGETEFELERDLEQINRLFRAAFEFIERQ